MENTQKFTGLAEAYTAGRPAYSLEFVDALYSEYGFSEKSVIADIGSGTGKFAEQLLKRGSRVYCVEPNDDMRNTAIKELCKYENFKAVKGTASETELNDNVVDYITVAQAFHWFDVSEFKRECTRILRENGFVFLIWNVRDMSNIVNQTSYEIFSKYCPDFRGFSGGMQKDDVRIKEFFDDEYEYVEFDNPLFYNKEKFISRSLSGSYSLKPGDKDYQEYVEQLSNLFDQNEDNGVLALANKTVAYIGRMK